MKLGLTHNLTQDEAIECIFAKDERFEELKVKLKTRKLEPLRKTVGHRTVNIK